MAKNPVLLVAAFGALLGVSAPLEIEPGRYVAFECLGERDCLSEMPSRKQVRGSTTTSADAATRYRHHDGAIEIPLIEWKYVEDYQGRELARSRHNRQCRYRSLWSAADSPLRTDTIPYEDLFIERCYSSYANSYSLTR
jgi:hypothetical protein